VLMILLVYFLPDGIVPAVRDWWQRHQDNALRAVPAGRGLEETAR
jgi:hypothetical protein